MYVIKIGQIAQFIDFFDLAFVFNVPSSKVEKKIILKGFKIVCSKSRLLTMMILVLSAVIFKSSHCPIQVVC